MPALTTGEMKRKIFGFLKNFLPCFLLILVAYLIVTGKYVCPFLRLFKIPCPGCGMTRAYKALLSFRFKEAIEYHCLFPLPAFWFVRILFSKRLSLKRKTENILLLSQQEAA